MFVHLVRPKRESTKVSHNSAVTFEDFNQIAWREMPTDNCSGQNEADTINTERTASNIYPSQADIQ